MFSPHAQVSQSVVINTDGWSSPCFWSPSYLISGSPSLPRQAEIWQLWGQLRQEEPQLADNLEGFLAKMTSRLQEARADKEVLELTLRK